jgi:Fe-S cluster assembly protein SufD
MINLIKKNSLEFFNANGLPSKKLENWKFTSSKNFKSFNKSSSSIKNQKIESDELSIVFVNGVLDKNSLKNFKFSDLLEVKNLDELNDKELLRCSENFLKESMFNLGISEFEHGSYLSFKRNSVIEEVINIKNYFFENGNNERVSSFNIFHINEGSEISIIEEDIKENHSIFNLKLNKFICENSTIFKYGKF